MAKMATPKLTVEARKHYETTRKNIPIAEIGEDMSDLLNGDIFCRYNKRSRVGAGDTASVFPHDDISRPFDKSTSGWIAVEVGNPGGMTL